MKYAFCYTLEKMVSQDEKDPEAIDAEGFHCGPWRDTEDEARKDEDLFRNDREAFFRLMENNSHGA